MTALCLAIGCFAAPGALAAPTWLAPTDISEVEAIGYDSRVGVDAEGSATALMEVDTPSNPPAVHVVERPAGGGWGLSRPLCDCGFPWASGPALAVNARGDAVAVWSRERYIEASFRPAGGAWEDPLKLTVDNFDFRAREPAVGIDAEGNATAVWRWYREIGDNGIAQVSTRPFGGAWSPSKDLSDEERSVTQVDLAVDPGGNAVAAWSSRSAAGEDVARYSLRTATGPWSAPEDLPVAEGESFDPKVAMDARGAAFALWRADRGGEDVIEAATRPAAGDWSEATELSPAGERSFEPQIAADPGGNAIALWRVEGASSVLQVAEKPAAGQWRKAEDLGEATPFREPRLAIGSRGDAVAIWHRPGETAQDAIAAAVKPVAGSWGTATAISADSPEAGYPDVAVDPEGNATAVWSWADLEEELPRIQAAGYDAAGPQLRSLSIPTGGLIGQALPFGVTPFDVWSPLAATSWSFGDGSSAPGTSVAHAYASAGSFAPAVTATDAVGNSSTAAGSLAIAPEAQKPHPPPPSFAEARLLGVATVRNGKALLKLRCGPMPCAGNLRLVVPLERKRGKRSKGGKASSEARGSAKGRKRQRTIGKTAISMRPKSKRTLAVRLTRYGLKRLRSTPNNRLRVRVRGNGVKDRSTLLKESRRAKNKRKRN